MSDTFERIMQLVASAKVRISEHGYDELADDDLTAREVVEGIESAILIEDYPDFPKGPAILLLQYDRNKQPVHVVWGIAKGYNEPAVLVTAYRSDPMRWKPSFVERRR